MNRRGATLPLTILLLSLMGVGVAISYSRISSERRTTGDGMAQLGAFAVAQSGLNRFLSNTNGKPAGPFPLTATYNDLPGGTAQVDLRQLRESTTTLLPALYVITSRGTYTGGKRYDVLAPAAQRTVATYALWTPAPFEIHGAMTSLSGINKNGGSGNLSGFDRCNAAPAIHGVAVPNGGYSGPIGPIHGNPEDTPNYLGDGPPSNEAMNEVEIDWPGIVAWPNTTMFPDLRHTTANPIWPTATDFLDWPVVRVDNEGEAAFTLPGTCTLGVCKGILIVTGDLALSGAVSWEGLILVGGVLTSNGNNQVYGATVAGLNVKLGMNPLPSDIANGTKTFQYDSCALQRALGQIGSIQRVRNGWSDNWSSY